jgi:hypothetical protein
MAAAAMSRAASMLLALAVAAGAGPVAAQDDAAAACRGAGGLACYASFRPGPPGSGNARYFASALPGPAAFQPTVLLIALHGHARDARHTFAAAVTTAQLAGQADTTLVVAPLFQVAGNGAKGQPDHGCHAAGVPAAQDGDLLWTCGSWLGGEAAEGGGVSSFVVLDTLIQHLVAQWPSLRRVTLAGFSAGGQLVQRYVGFAEAGAPHALPVRYVVADPGSWLYFDAERPQPDPDCAAQNQWKYGTDGLPAGLGRSAAQARVRYAAADVRYLEGSEDQGLGPGKAGSVLDQSCAARAQGPWRLQRGLAYAEYDRRMLATGRPRGVGIAPGCAHDVACVFPSEAGRAALLGP